MISSGESDTAPVQTAEANQLAADGQPIVDGSSGDQAIIIPWSPELWPTGQTEPDRAARSESNEDDPAPSALQVIPPSNLAEEQPSRSKYMRFRLPRPHRSDQVITENYLPPRGPERSRVEVSAPGAEEVKDILRRWEPFHRAESTADRLGNLYPHIYRMPMVARGLGLREDYTVTLPATTSKEDFLKIIDDGIQVQNRSFVQSTELVRYGVLSGGIIVIACFLSFYWVSLQVVAAIRNMALQHHEFELRLRDAKRLRLYVQSRMAEQEMQNASLKKAEMVCRRLELEVKESAERAA